MVNAPAEVRFSGRPDDECPRVRLWVHDIVVANLLVKHDGNILPVVILQRLEAKLKQLNSMLCTCRASSFQRVSKPERVAQQGRAPPKSDAGCSRTFLFFANHRRGYEVH